MQLPYTTHIIAVAVSGDGTPTAGQNYILTFWSGCHCAHLHWWRKYGSVFQGETAEILSFSSLRLSGRYTCEVIVNSMTLTDDENVFIMSKISKLVHCVYYLLSPLCSLVPCLSVVISQVIQLAPSGLLDLMSP